MEVRTSLRMAGEVKRYHTWPTVQSQTVAEHSWQVMRILREIWPEEATAEVYEYILLHDVAEIGTGDIPYGAKSPELRAALEVIESEVLDNLGVMMPDLTPRQRDLIKMCDLLEMWEFGEEEIRRGCIYGRVILRNVGPAVIGHPLWGELSEGVREKILWNGTE